MRICCRHCWLLVCSLLLGAVSCSGDPGTQDADGATSGSETSVSTGGVSESGLATSSVGTSTVGSTGTADETGLASTGSPSGGPGSESTADSGGQSDVSAQLEASRISCVSPCTVVFSAQATSDVQRSEPATFSELGYHFDFGDPRSGTFASSGKSKNTQVGGPVAAHTFECARGQCTFQVGVRAENPEGERDDAFITVTVDAPSTRFGAVDTICVSTSGTYSGSVPCPPGAEQRTAVPSPGEYGGKRVLLRRGESFGDVCIDYSESDVLVEPFGDETQPPPVVAGEIAVGVRGNCSSRNFDTAYADLRNAEGWVSNVTVTALRVGGVSYGAVYRHIGVHDLDMDFESGGEQRGTIALTTATGRCYNNDELDCGSVPFPQGAYVSEVNLVGTQGSEPVVNIGLFDCPMVNWLTVLGSTARSANEHNMRSQGASRMFIGHNIFEGGHVLAGRQKMTLRGSGVTSVDLSAERRDATTWANIDPEGNGPVSEFIIVADNTFGTSQSETNGWKAGMTPQNGEANEGLELGIFERNVFVDNPAQPTNDLRLAGRNLSARDNDYSPVGLSECQDRSESFENLPAEFKTVADCDGATPPTPDAPGS